MSNKSLGPSTKVQIIYIDPPYGIKFGSNWLVSTRKREVKDGKAEDSRPFDPPDTSKIAVKVINHYGDEVLKVCEVKSKK